MAVDLPATEVDSHAANPVGAVSVQKQSFWRGIAAGFLAGLTVAAALRYTPVERFISRLSTVEGKLDNKAAAATITEKQGLVPTPASSYSRRDDSESVQVQSTISDPVDPTPPNRKYPRSFEMGSAG